MQQVHHLDKQKRWHELSVVLLDNEGIAAINDAYLGTPVPTDVLTFAYDPVPGQEPHWIGEVLVNVERAVTEGLKRQSKDWELALYIAHGCHHLTGARDDTPFQRAQMRRRERHWLKQAQRLNLSQPLIGKRRHV